MYVSARECACVVSIRPTVASEQVLLLLAPVAWLPVPDARPLHARVPLLAWPLLCPPLPFPLSLLSPGKTSASASSPSRSATTLPSALSTLKASTRTSCSMAPSTPSSSSGAKAWRRSPGAPSRWSFSGESSPRPACRLLPRVGDACCAGRSVRCPQPAAPWRDYSASFPRARTYSGPAHAQLRAAHIGVSQCPGLRGISWCPMRWPGRSLCFPGSWCWRPSELETLREKSPGGKPGSDSSTTPPRHVCHWPHGPALAECRGLNSSREGPSSRLPTLTHLRLSVDQTPPSSNSLALTPAPSSHCRHLRGHGQEPCPRRHAG